MIKKKYTAKENFKRLSDISLLVFMIMIGHGAVNVNAQSALSSVCTPAYAALPYSESFESWVNCNGANDVPASNWMNTPSTGNNSWRKYNEGASAGWTSTSGAYFPASSTGSYSARFHSHDAPLGSQGSLDLYINCSTGNADKFITFDYMNPSGSDLLSVLISTNGGSTFTEAGSSLAIATFWAIGTFTFTSTSATTVIRFSATSDFGTSDLGIDNLKVGESCSPVYASFPYSQSFENWVNCSGITDSPSQNWKNTPAGGNNSWRRNDQGPSASWSGNNGGYTPVYTLGSHSARFHTYHSTSGSQGSLDLYIDCSTGGNAKQVTFDYVNKSGSDKLAVLLSVDGGTTFSQLEVNLTIASAWTPQIFSFSSTSPTTVIRLRATSDKGTTDIGIDNLKVIAGPAANDQCSAAIALTCGNVVNSSTATATTAGEDVLPACGITLVDAPGVWYKITGTGTSITANTCGGTSNFDTRLHIYSGTCSSLLNVGCNNNGCGLQSSVTWNSVAGTTYYILVNGSSNNTGLFTLTVSCSGDRCSNATPVPCGGSISGNTTSAGSDGGLPACLANGKNFNGLWHSITPAGTGPLNLSLCGTIWDTYLRVFSGTCSALSCVAGNDDSCSKASSVTFSATAGVKYNILVSSSVAGGYGAYTLTASCPPTTPFITDFTPTSGCEGSLITINGFVLSGATSVTIGGTPVTSIISNTATQITALTGNGTTGAVSVTTPLGSATSSQTFTVVPFPMPDASSNAPICEGSDLFLFGNNFAAGQSGGNSWLWNGPDGFTSTLQNVFFSAAAPGSGGTYLLTVTNIFGCSASASMDVIVNPNPVESVALQTSACNGPDGSVDIDAANGTPPYSFYLSGNQTFDGIYTGLASGPYDISVSDDNGCTNTISIVIAEGISPTADVSGTATVCSGDSASIHLAFTGTPPWNYTLTDGVQNITNTSIVNPDDVKIVSNAVGSHSYNIIALSDANCSSGTSTGSATVTVKKLPAANITPLGPTTFCAGDSVVLRANSGTGLTYQWKKASALISGATLRDYPAKTAGKYRVIVTNSNSCSKTSAGTIVTVNCRQGNEQAGITKMEIFPNPSNGKVTLVLISGENKTGELMLTEVSGKEMMRIPLTIDPGTNEYTFDLTNQSKGIYLMHVITDKEVYNQKIVLD
jgi:hypothetical protein